MVQCPICKERYERDQEHCPKCLLRNIETLEAKSDKGQGKKTFVEVFRTENVAIADLIKEVLEDNEIICYLQDYSLARIYPSLTASQIKVMVYKEDIEEAEELIGLFFREEH